MTDDHRAPSPSGAALTHALERSLEICATRDVVFSFFTDSARFAAWWGEGSTIDGRVGGAVRIRYPNGATASGEVLELDPPRRVVFTFGYDDPGKPLAPGASRVTIELDEVRAGTRLRLRHEMSDAAVRDMHAPGWRFQLARFANVAAEEQHREVAARVDRWFAAWSAPGASVSDDPAPDDSASDAAAAALAEVVTADVAFRDAFGCTVGVDELLQHIAAARMHLPGSALARSGPVRQCQGTAVCDWTATGPSGAPVGRGTNVFELAADGRIAGVTGLWAPPT